MLEDMLIGAVVGGLCGLVAFLFKSVKNAVRNGKKKQSENVPVMEKPKDLSPEPAPAPVKPAAAWNTGGSNTNDDRIFVLKGVSGKYMGREFPLEFRSYTFGTEEGCDFRFLPKTGISPRHCVLELNRSYGTMWHGLDANGIGISGCEIRLEAKLTDCGSETGTVWGQLPEMPGYSYRQLMPWSPEKLPYHAVLSLGGRHRFELITCCCSELAPKIQEPVYQLQQVPEPEYDRMSTGGPAVSLLQIRALNGPLEGQVFPLYFDAAIPDRQYSLSIGRDPGCDVVFPLHTPGISRLHCMITGGDETATLIDNDSTYGTYLGDGTGLPPKQRCRLNIGYTFCLGGKGGPAFRLERRSNT